MEFKMKKALYERVIIEVMENDVKDDTPLKGMSSKTSLVKVKVIDWGTDITGKPFPLEAGVIGYMEQGARLIPTGPNQFLTDRRLILGTE